jgi:hypothetical protein
MPSIVNVVPAKRRRADSSQEIILGITPETNPGMAPAVAVRSTLVELFGANSSRAHWGASTRISTERALMRPYLRLHVLDGDSVHGEIDDVFEDLVV